MRVKNVYESLILCLLLFNFYATIFFEVESYRIPSNESYWREREALVEEDLDMMLGYDLNLTSDEEKVNDILMTLKDEEMNKGFETLDFLAAKQFVQSKESIDKSPVFQFIQKMPKGAILHIHDMAMASVDWVIRIDLLG
ncbi:Adenosine deaminase CECR1-A [Armadillidium vulgare]|nr:Adenosine deaminase CECR1-A [Armadillidium vulgare]